MNIWLSPEIMDWNFLLLDASTESDTEHFKPYRILKHAKKILGEVGELENIDEENLALGDAIKGCKEAVEHREKQLKEKFNLERLPIEMPKRTREKLFRLGIIQPIMLKKFTELRNQITHEQKYPLGKNRNEILLAT